MGVLAQLWPLRLIANEERSQISDPRTDPGISALWWNRGSGGRGTGRMMSVGSRAAGISVGGGQTAQGPTVSGRKWRLALPPSKSFLTTHRGTELVGAGVPEPFLHQPQLVRAGSQD